MIEEQLTLLTQLFLSLDQLQAVGLVTFLFYLGGFVLSKRGGYENPKSVYYVFLFACLGIGAACIIPFVEAFIPAVILLWIVLFFGGSMMPGLTGIMMASVPPYLRAFGNSNG